MSDVTALERKVQILTRLTEISASLNSTMKLKPLLSLIMEATVEITQSDAAAVLLWDYKANELRFAASTNNPGSADLLGKPVPLNGSIAGSVLRDNQIVMVNSVEREPRHYSRIDQEGDFQTRSVLGVPMTSKNRVIGVLEAVNKRHLPWTQDDCNYASILASQAAVAIEGAQMVSQLQKANEELAQLDKAKSDFISIASHELRTPLGVILGYSSFLQDAKDREVSEHATKVVNSALQLRRIIEDLTNLRFLQVQPGQLNRERVLLSDLLRDVERDIAAVANGKKHDLRFAKAPNVILKVDRARMGMALLNVVNNAIRFTPDGGRIYVQAEVRDQNVHISVSDNGVGFPREQAERLFEKFYQVEDHMTRKHGGLGIGLSITRGMVEAHGGRIWAYSPGLNYGSTFTVALPLGE